LAPSADLPSGYDAPRAKAGRTERSPLGTVTIDGDPWFVAADVCKALEIKNSKDAVSRLDDDEKRLIDKEIFRVGNTDPKTDNRGNKEVTIINESGFYNLVMTSRTPPGRNSIPAPSKARCRASLLLSLTCSS
jgi:prophage antirepressor-like protein